MGSNIQATMRASITEHKESFVVDMRKNFDPSSNTSQYVPYDMILVFPNSASCNLLKDQIIEYYRKICIGKPPSPISGGEMYEINSKENDQKLKFNYELL